MKKWVPKNDYTPIVVVYKRKWTNSKPQMKIFTNFKNPDPIIEDIKGKHIPAAAAILEIGVGESFKESYKKKYKI
tara:strand:- start:399 stop:623 length:225 start_codon:yes stop_codon:yes gene_type:complete